MKNRKQIRNIVEKSVKASFREGKLIEKKAATFVKLFNSQPKAEAIQLLSQLLKRMKLEINSATLIVESVIPLSKKQKDIIKKKFSAKFTVTNSQFKINPQILGGLRIRVGDHIYDDSIKMRIYQVKEAIAG
ncbi:F0F1 ATP synthase subunit delta [Candidatus Daviesbacteria bacterium]|nr:F0F1 ATP synthase subunit delta [Candidatus Daviesbacteria bacterium]